MNIAINGFGRIGRLTLRQLIETRAKNIKVVAVNDLTDTKTLAYLFKHDSAHGNFTKTTVTHGEGYIKIGRSKILVFKERDPSNLPWRKLKIDLVIESTGFFLTSELAKKHLDAGAKKVLISAPAKSADIKMIVYGVNENKINKSDKIISAASCTTNCLAPIVDKLNNAYGIKYGFMTTIHAFTNDQRVVDSPHADLRRARAASYNIIPTSTGAAAAIGKVIPKLNGLLDGIAMRVPTITGSLVDFVFAVNKNDVDVKSINELIKNSASDTIGYTAEPIVSTDIIGDTHGTIFDASLTTAIETGKEKLFKIVSWYDNESSYIGQLIRVAHHFLTVGK